MSSLLDLCRMQLNLGEASGRYSRSDMQIKSELRIQSKLVSKLAVLVMRLKSNGRDYKLGSRKRGGDAGFP